MAGRVELFEAIRRDRRLEGLSVRALAARHRVHRRMVRQALAAALPPPRKACPRPCPAIGPWTEVIEDWLVADKTAPGKQRHTARRIWQRLGAEHGAVLSEVTVSRYVRRRRVELGLGDSVEVMVPQDHAPGAEGEADFGEFYAEIDGEVTKCHLFILRLSASGKGVSTVSLSEGQEAFLEGHVRAFEQFGGVPARIRYDNLTSAVVRVLRGRRREETERFIALRSHYGFDSFFCRPGKEGGHEKGGVESEIGWFRRRHLVPVPKVGSFAEVTELIAAADELDNARVIEGRHEDVGTAFAAEAPRLGPLPSERFESRLTLHPLVDRHARITVRCCRYSVPASLVGRRVRVLLGASALQVFDGRRLVAVHQRSNRKGSTILVLDHYLEVLRRKPGALPGATALAQARRAGTFTSEHDAFWSAARHALGDPEGTRELVDVLLLHRRYPHAAVVAGIAAALSAGAVRADVVAVETRRLTDRHVPGPPKTCLPGPELEPAGSNRRVVSLTERRLADPAAVIAGLPPDHRPLPTITGYDQLLTRRPQVVS
ncbi:MAG: family transposase [Pseudonocardia sp.]|nr:family transposase [Pseudonocardia sp.]